MSDKKGYCMVTFQSLEALGYDRTFFKLPARESQKEEFVYYTYDTNLAQWQPSYWDIVGVHRRSENPLLLDLAFLHIDEEALDWEPFEALRDADSYLSVNPPEFQAVIRFFEALLDDRYQHRFPEKETLKHFHQLEREALLSLHFRPWQLGYAGHYYRYVLGDHMQGSEKMTMITFPIWSLKYGLSQSSMLAMETFDQKRLADPESHPFGSSEWPESITFDQSALAEFISLLKHHSYEQAMRREFISLLKHHSDEQTEEYRD